MVPLITMDFDRHKIDDMPTRYETNPITAAFGKNIRVEYFNWCKCFTNRTRCQLAEPR